MSSLTGPHQTLFDKLRIKGDGVQLFIVHLLTKQEYQLKLQKDSDAILDLFDDANYPFFLDEDRSTLRIKRKRKPAKRKKR